MTEARLIFRPIDPREAAIQRFAYFRRAALKVRTDLEADFVEWFGFRSGEARILAALYAHPGTIRVYLAKIREALGEGALPPSGEDGSYQLTQFGRAECAHAVAEVGLERLRRELMGVAA